MTDLKAVMMNLGNKLVLEHGYEPARYSESIPGNITQVISMFTSWMNDHSEAQEVLRELGFSWSMPKKGKE